MKYKFHRETPKKAYTLVWFSLSDCFLLCSELRTKPLEEGQGRSDEKEREAPKMYGVLRKMRPLNKYIHLNE